jgi:hypothetical protein
MRRDFAAAAVVAALCVRAGPARAAIGLQSRFGDVILEGVRAGHTYDIGSQAHVPFAVENTGDAQADVVIEFERPMKSVLKKGYEPIPDPSWVKAIPGRLSIAPKSVGYFDLFLTVPGDPALKGKSYQCEVKARTVGTGMLAVAVEGDLRFSLGPGPASLAAEKRLKAMQQLDYDMTPQRLYLTDVPTGGKWDSRREERKLIRVANYAPDRLALHLTVGRWDPEVPLPDGYEPIPDPGWVRVEKSTLAVGTDEIAVTGLVVDVPDKPQYRGRRWAAMVRAALTTGFWLDSRVQLFVDTRK